MLKSIKKSEDRLVAAKLLDKAEFASKTNRLAHSDFLDPHQVRVAERILQAAGVCEYAFFGGFAGAEREVAVFKPEYAGDDELEQYRNEILKCIEIMPLYRSSLSHRDYLGALMSLGIRRDITGDIVVKDDICSVIVLSDISDYIAGNLSKVGNIGVSVKIKDIMELRVPEPKASEIKATVAALRLDSLCAPSFGLSRSKAAELIKAGRVQLNWEITLDTDKTVAEGDTLSIRGKGRAVLYKVGDRTRKDRVSIIIKKLM